MSDIKYISTPYSYSSAVDIGNLVFLGLHRGFGKTFAMQFDDTFKNLKNTLDNLGLKTANIVKVNVWLKKVKNLPEMELLFNNYFEKGKFPARMTATTKFIDKDCLIMIDGIAMRDNI